MDTIVTIILLILLALIVIFILASMIKIVPQSKAYVVERIGADRKSTRLNSSHITRSRMPSSA